MLSPSVLEWCSVESRGAVCLQPRPSLRGEKRREIKTLAMKKRFPGVDNWLHKILDAKMDHAAARRQAREAFKDIQLGIDHILFKVCLSICIKLECVFFYLISFFSSVCS